MKWLDNSALFQRDGVWFMSGLIALDEEMMYGMIVPVDMTDDGDGLAVLRDWEKMIAEQEADDDTIAGGDKKTRAKAERLVLRFFEGGYVLKDPYASNACMQWCSFDKTPEEVADGLQLYFKH